MSLSISACGHRTLDRTWRGKTHNEHYARLYLITGGEAHVEINDEHLTLTPGHQYLFPARTNLHYYCNRDVTIMWIHVTVQLSGGLDLMDLVHSQPMIKPVDLDQTKARFETVITGFKSPDLRDQLHVRGALLELLVPSLLPYKETDARLTAILPALEFIEAHFRQSISLEELARCCGYERTYFSTCFKRATGTAPVRFIHRRRIDEARGILAQTNDKLEAVAQDLGYNDAFHFSKTFKKITGQSPREFRQQSRTPTP